MTPEHAPNSTPPAARPPYQYRGGCACQRCQRRGLLGPVVLITLGALFLLHTLEVGLGFGELWPLLLVAIGVVKLFETTASTEGHRG